VSKLNPRYFGLFSITKKIGKVAYRPQLPEGIHIYPVFHVFLLKSSTEAEPVDIVLPTPRKGKEGPMGPEAIIDRRVVHN